MLKHHFKHHAQASCPNLCQAMPYARTHARTDGELLTFSSYLTFVNVRETSRNA